MNSAAYWPFGVFEMLNIGCPNNISPFDFWPIDCEMEWQQPIITINRMLFAVYCFVCSAGVGKIINAYSHVIYYKQHGQVLLAII